MSTLAWIVLSGILMSALALVGSVTLILPERTFKTLVLPMVSLAAGLLLGGALFHMLPEAVDEIGNRLAVYVWLGSGILSFFVLQIRVGSVDAAGSAAGVPPPPSPCDGGGR